MAKAKKLNIPGSDYTGATVKHTVTAQDLKDNPSLVEAGIVEGAEIDIVAPEEKDPKAKASAERAEKIAKQFNVELVVENTITGEFFTSENLALLSVKGDKAKLKNHNF